LPHLHRRAAAAGEAAALAVLQPIDLRVRAAAVLVRVGRRRPRRRDSLALGCVSCATEDGGEASGELLDDSQMLQLVVGSDDADVLEDLRWQQPVDIVVVRYVAASHCKN